MPEKLVCSHWLKNENGMNTSMQPVAKCKLNAKPVVQSVIAISNYKQNTKPL